MAYWMPPNLIRPIPWPVTAQVKVQDSRIIAIAPSPVQLSQHVKSVTVLIRSESGLGSGVLIQRQGGIYTVLTTAHTVMENTKYSVILPDESRYAVSQIKPIAGIDLAILTFKSDRSYPVAALGRSQDLVEGSSVCVAGFPASSVAISQPVFTFTQGSITTHSSKPLKDGYAIVYSNNTLPGMSGGGVFNAAGQLVGIHGRADLNPQLEPTEDPSIRIKTGFNLGIPIETFIQHAHEVGLTPKIPSPFSNTAQMIAPSPPAALTQNDDSNTSSTADFNIVKHNIESLLKIVEKRYANFKQKGLAGLDESFSGAWWSRVDLEAARKMLIGKERGKLSIGKKFKSGDRQNPKYSTIKQHFETCEKYTQEMEAARKIKFIGYDQQYLVFIETKTGLRLSVQQVQRL
jgi:hypothetical protein